LSSGEYGEDFLAHVFGARTLRPGARVARRRNGYVFRKPGSSRVGLGGGVIGLSPKTSVDVCSPAVAVKGSFSAIGETVCRLR
jgi:hypothetical protein